MKRLWINADDFGLTDGVSAGIVTAIHQGALGSTTAMLCVDEADATLARHAPAIPGRIGLHLQLTGGVPRSGASEVPSLVGPDGRFPRKRQGIHGPDLREVEREWEAQLAALRALGVTPTHLDSHHHVHRLPGVFEVFVRLALRHRLPARGSGPLWTTALRRQGVPTADVFCEDYSDGPLGVAQLVLAAAAAAERAPEGGTVELMSHPGLVDEGLRAQSDYVEPRERELATLCSPELPGRLEERGMVLAGPAELWAAGAV